jgi:hypothetical protein
MIGTTNNDILPKRINGFLPTRSLNLPNGIVNTIVDAVIKEDATAISSIDEFNQSLSTTMKKGQAIDIANEKKTATKLNLRNSLGCDKSLYIGGNLRDTLPLRALSLIPIESSDAHIPNIAVRKNRR